MFLGPAAALATSQPRVKHHENQTIILQYLKRNSSIHPITAYHSSQNPTTQSVQSVYEILNDLQSDDLNVSKSIDQGVFRYINASRVSLPLDRSRARNNANEWISRLPNDVKEKFTRKHH